jgi:hypothetical protein
VNPKAARAAWLACGFAAGLSLTAGAQGNAGDEKAPLRSQASLPDTPGIDVAKANCTGCHGAALIVGQRLARTGWDREVAKMERWSRPVPSADRDRLLDYLVRHFGLTRTPSPADGFTGP